MNAPATQPDGDLLDRILAQEPPSFALLHRLGPDGSPGTVDVLVGDVSPYASLADLPLTDLPPAGARPEVLVLVPYRQLAERGFAAPDDGEPLLAMSVSGHQQLPVSEVAARVPQAPAALSNRRFDVEDEEYADLVRRVVADEIGTGEGANFVIKRSLLVDIGDYSVRNALSFFRRLLTGEQGAYWTFVIHTGRRTFVGASPERHVSLSGGTAVMNPISGTYRYPPGGPTLAGVTDFLADRKETDELYMVLDEELKTMARICERGARITGPYLREMSRLAHTEYFVEGRSDRDPREVLRETMFAPTVTGSPVESAARVISRYEPAGRGYYSGVAALIGRDAGGERTMDSAILIRTADIDAEGRVRIAAGSTLVRHSDPDAEAAETRAKVSGLLAALEADEGPRFAHHPDVLATLRRRNTGIGDFWLRDPDTRLQGALADLAGLKTLVVDAEDSFTAMLALQLGTLGMQVEIRRYDEAAADGYDLVVMGPGPGDPRSERDPKIGSLRAATDALLAERRPFVAVCLSHQVLSARLGLDLTRLKAPNQGVQREIELFGARERVGFYNTFAARSARDTHHAEGVGSVRVSRDPLTGEVHALRGPHFASLQFHAESVLTVGGPRIVAETIRGALRHAR
ncbi:anthranilate synthase family protein [Actinacidiphila bryophytorum]|uniref:anthranilate synthase n=1 Tax=Actinacidiphila bryophytorum TaxID=1436133 RepID=A0A9W4GYU6_9ACTN|nr:anthranilate synthase family protein [Actinacidiphila bryophytorum]MBM9437964.1 chorismate-binding protein [Actinacidiphila bryophytorum]MBN6542657.1 chorismate-binding protein [Actinacidiphila bryophytorum]CAG7617441.1 Glutamine amidotransferase [Actinacidiphila bryophytorum]